jgi:hypothetical protein
MNVTSDTNQRLNGIAGSSNTATDAFVNYEWKTPDLRMRGERNITIKDEAENNRLREKKKPATLLWRVCYVISD